ncbi:MAG: hypothetical protein DLM54_09200 [Acidimicrobiales bacterium]|nr:MAG: hypothetical protein DLM54_09200 [Acidimicrobiales bacterium]
MSHVVALVPDLMDRSKVQAAARGAGAILSLVAEASALAEAASEDADLVIVDLSRPGALDALPDLARVRTVGFASHVNRALMQGAQEAGCQEVLARSAFFRRLPDLLAGRSSVPPGPDERVAGDFADGENLAAGR